MGASKPPPKQPTLIERAEGIANAHARWKRPGADTEDWLRGLRELRRRAMARKHFVLAEELRAEIAEAMALLDRAYEAAVA